MFGEADQPKDVNSPLVVRYMLNFSAPHRRKRPFNSSALNVTASGRPSSRRSFPMRRLNPKERKLDIKKRLGGEILLPFHLVAKRGQSQKKKKVTNPFQQQWPRTKASRKGRKKERKRGDVPEKMSNLAVKSNDVVFVSRRGWYVYSSGSL